MTFDLIKDLSELTTIPDTTITKLFEKAAWCICNDIYEAKLDNKTQVDIDMIVGMLHIHIENNQIKYMFEPSKKLESAVRETIIENKNPLSNVVETMLAYRITNAYKDYL